MRTFGIRALATVALVLLAGTAAAAGVPADDRLQLKDVFQLEYASDPQASPDGKQVVYVRNFMDIMNDRQRSHLWMIYVHWTEHRSLTDGDHDESSPRWSHDGKRLLYIGEAGSSSQMYCRWMDTGQTTQLTRGTAAPASPAWSPDGKTIAFSMFVEDADKPFAD